MYPPYPPYNGLNALTQHDSVYQYVLSQTP